MLSLSTEAAMNVSVGRHWEQFIDELVKSGRYGSASEVVRDGLRRIEQQEARLKSLRENIGAALDDDTWYTWDEVEAHVKESLDDDVKNAAE
jgi:antitoxin ParD1/3/4